MSGLAVVATFHRPDRGGARAGAARRGRHRGVRARADGVQPAPHGRGGWRAPRGGRSAPGARAIGPARGLGAGARRRDRRRKRRRRGAVPAASATDPYRVRVTWRDGRGDRPGEGRGASDHARGARHRRRQPDEGGRHRRLRRGAEAAHLQGTAGAHSPLAGRPRRGHEREPGRRRRRPERDCQSHHHAHEQPGHPPIAGPRGKRGEHAGGASPTARASSRRAPSSRCRRGTSSRSGGSARPTRCTATTSCSRSAIRKKRRRSAAGSFQLRRRPRGSCRGR